MIPIFVSPETTRIALVGRGERSVSRLNWLIEAGAAPEVWSDAPIEALEIAVGGRLRRGLPELADLRGYQLIWISDLPHDLANGIAVSARALHRLVNVEDTPDLCDFHSPAVVRRGGLTLAAGTGGASPAVARAARERLEKTFPLVWGEALETIARSRRVLRESGVASAALAADARARLTDMGLI